MAGMERSVPTTNSPACPSTVQWRGKAGIDEYGIVMVGESGSNPSDRPDRPEPQMIPITGMGMERERSSDRMYDAARR
jgi:hypothetical protein